MRKILGLLVIGLAAGAAIVMYLRHDSKSESLLVASDSEAQGVDVQKSLAALDRRVRDLTSQVATLQAARGAMTVGTGAAADGDAAPQRRRPGDDWPAFGEARTPADITRMREEMQKREMERFTAAGFTPERVEWINRRTEELRVAAMQAQYEAQRTGQRVDTPDADQLLRKEMGDAEYERYLKATGRSTEVRVMDVLATSAAERAGLKAGDEILSYGGKRVYDTRDLNALTMQGNPSGSVTVEVKRDGQTVQLTVASGPLGVTAPGGGRQGGGFGGGGPPGGPGGGGPPGGFRGGR